MNRGSGLISPRADESALGRGGLLPLLRGLVTLPTEEGKALADRGGEGGNISEAADRRDDLDGALGACAGEGEDQRVGEVVQLKKRN